MHESDHSLELLIDGPSQASCSIVLAHGAGAPMDSDFMNYFAAGLASDAKRETGLSDCRVVRFEFPYMAQRRTQGKRRPPDREPVLRATWLQAIEAVRSERMIIGGKSMGGRIASLIADEANVDGLVCLGYPFHPVGKPDKLRVEHLQTLAVPTLIVQGERDSLGSKSEAGDYSLSPSIRLHWLADGDHSFKPRKKSGRTLLDNWQAGVEAVDAFVKQQIT